MLFLLANTYFAGIELEAAFDVRVNGQIVSQRADIFRAAQAKNFARGNLTTAVTFSVSRVHDSVLEAQRFAWMHFAGLPKSGDLRVTLGEVGDQSDVLLPGCVLLSADVIPKGRGTVTTYNLVGGLPTDGGDPVDLEPYADLMRRDNVSITNGATSVAVVFSSSLPSAPYVTVAVLKPTGDAANIWATVVADTITNNGFTVELSGPVPTGTYKLSYIALV